MTALFWVVGALLAEQGIPLVARGADRPFVRFVNVATAAGLDFRHTSGASTQKLMPETMGSGVAVLDYDDDGWPDLFFANGSDLAGGKPSPGNRLFHNRRDGTFADVTAGSGLGGSGGFAMGAAVGDFDNDGRLDLYVTGYGANSLYRNQGDGTFAEVAARAGVVGAGWSTSAAFLDYNRDGWLDLFVARYLDYDLATAAYCGYKREGYRMYCHPQAFDGVPDLLYLNNRDGTFTDVSRRAGVANPAGKGLGVAVGDVDLDGWPDLFVANDGVRNFLYRNRGDGTFADVTFQAGVGFGASGIPLAGMGTEIADYDADLLPDIFLTAFSREHNTLYRNQGRGEFEDTTLQAGLKSGLLSLGFGTKFLDFDNDGDLDVHVTNGHVTDNVALYDPMLAYRQKDLLYENVGGGRFEDVSAQSGPALQIEHVGRGSAVLDFDQDGDVDIVVADCGGPPLLLRNDGRTGNHWLALRARGQAINRFGVGAKVRLTAGARIRVQEIGAAGSYLSSSDLRLHFGLGREAKVARLEIEWPSGRSQTLVDLEADRTLVLEESQVRP